VPTGTQSFTFELRQGASATAQGTTLEAATADATNGGVINFSTFLVPGNTYQLCETNMQPGWMTTLGPPLYTIYNPNGVSLTVCTDFTVTAGQTKTFNIDNSPPPGGFALTIGYWKNWASCSKSSGNKKPVLDQTLAKTEPTGIPVGLLTLHGSTATPNVAPSCQAAVNLLNKSTVNTAAKKSSDPAFNLAAQYVGAELNMAAGAGACTAAVKAMTDAQALLTAINFNGNTHTKLTAAQTSQANSLATTLDNYNNNRLC